MHCAARGLRLPPLQPWDRPPGCTHGCRSARAAAAAIPLSPPPLPSEGDHLPRRLRPRRPGGHLGAALDKQLRRGEADAGGAAEHEGALAEMGESTMIELLATNNSFSSQNSVETRPVSA